MSAQPTTVASTSPAEFASVSCDACGNSVGATFLSTCSTTSQPTASSSVGKRRNPKLAITTPTRAWTSE